MSFDTLLIANRGEIACRIIRTARKMGLRTVAVFSDADKDAPHVRDADEAVRIGPPPVGESYLNIDAVLDAAARSGADAIHPGYGFLSENADFARRVADAGITFVGPPAHAIEAMGDKAQAKAQMIAAGVPCVPGYQGDDQSNATLIQEAKTIGYPVMVKAAAGGGGRGMRVVWEAKDLPEALGLARSEAANAFGSDTLILERAVKNPRHVEVQIMADSHGKILHLFERDCSVQRRHQKVVEEAPCPVMTDGLRAAMTDAAILAARTVDYVGAGTVEFLLDDSGEFYFLEMNTRLQVEHPVTEMVTGLDLVEMQLQVAMGAALSQNQSDITLNGHAMEVRLYAEDPFADYLPTTGPIAAWKPCYPRLARTDAGIRSGQDVSPFYDPMLAKIIAKGADRAAATGNLIKALSRTVLHGPATNRAFLIDLLSQPAFLDGPVTTGFLEAAYPKGPQVPACDSADIALAAALSTRLRQEANARLSPSRIGDLQGWSSTGPIALPVSFTAPEVDVTVTIDKNLYHVDTGAGQHVVRFDGLDKGRARLRLDGRPDQRAFTFTGTDLWLSDHRDLHFSIPDPLALNTDAASADKITAPMPGVVVSVSAAAAEMVAEGDTMAVIEAMKMQHPVKAPRNARVAEALIAEGDQLTKGALMFRLEDEE